MHGDTLRAFLSIVSCIKNKPKYFAEKLEKSMKRLGTDNRTLIRIIVSRCEVDLGIIKKEFQSLTGKTLESYIHDETSGDFSLILLALVGA
uniref:Annexin n=1 Tax=Schistosoma japonicum TaxID=6182 RepID=Q5BSS7_SCHJA|nr:SJCHGC03399 protein [Schistosoma japonicum]